MHPQPSSKPDIPLIASDCWLYSTIPQWNPIVLLLVNPWTKVNQQKRGVQAAQLKIIPSITWTYPMYKWTIVVVPITRYCLNFGQDARWVNNLILEQLLVTIQIPEGVSVKWLRGLVVPFREAIWIDFSILCIYIYTLNVGWLIFDPFFVMTHFHPRMTNFTSKVTISLCALLKASDLMVPAQVRCQSL